MVNPNPMASITTDQVYAWLEEVKDPEIPVLSLNDLGVITDVHIADDAVAIEMTPTFVGCPALDMMQADIRQVLATHGVTSVSIIVSYRKPWTSDRISAKGNAALKAFGLAPPPSRELFTDLDILQYAACPRCGGNNTQMKSVFGSTLCRAIHYCNDCKETFEQFKQV